MRSNQLLARIGITIAAIAVFALVRFDVVMALFARLPVSGSHEIAERMLVAEKKLEAPGVIGAYLRNNSVRKLQFGAGPNSLPGWLNTDIEPMPGQAYLDASKPLPLPDRSFKYVYSEHLFEHLSYEDGMVMLKESFRILQPGGALRMATPNLLKFIALFEEHRTPEVEQFVQTKVVWHKWPHTPDPECYILNLQLRAAGHQFVYTPKMLRARLAEAGFRNIQERGVAQSDYPELRNLESRAAWDVKDANAYETMVFDAVRP